MIKRIRRIPTQGEVFVKVGESVRPETIVATGTVINPDIRKVTVATHIGVDMSDVEKYMLKEKGDEVRKDEVIAIRRSFFDQSTKTCRSPIDGTVEAFSRSSGIVLIRGKPILIEVRAHIPGEVVEIIPREGAVIECKGTLIRGMFGIGGERLGELTLAVDKADEPLTAEAIVNDYRGKIVVGGSFVTIDALHQAATTGANGIIIGGVDEKDLTEFLGYEIGIGVTGKEEKGLTLIITEGFGINPMDARLFTMLKSNEGKRASIDGSTQIRARMLRPEIIIPS